MNLSNFILRDTELGHTFEINGEVSWQTAAIQAFNRLGYQLIPESEWCKDCNDFTSECEHDKE